MFVVTSKSEVKAMSFFPGGVYELYTICPIVNVRLWSIKVPFADIAAGISVVFAHQKTGFIFMQNFDTYGRSYYNLSTHCWKAIFPVSALPCMENK